MFKLIIREMQIKTIQRSISPFMLAETIKYDNTFSWPGNRKQTLSYITDRNANWDNPSERVLATLHVHFPLDPAIPLLAVFPENAPPSGGKYICTKYFLQHCL